MPDTLKPSKLKSQSSEQRKVYRRAKQEELGSSCSKVLNSLTVWGEQIFRKVYRLRELHLIVDGEVTGWCSRNLSHQLLDSSQKGPRACTQPEVTIPHLGSCRRTQRYMSDCSAHPFRKSQVPVLLLCPCFLTAFPLCLHSLTPLIRNCLDFASSGKL